MANICMVPIPKMDVLMEDFSNIEELIGNIASDRAQLLEARNTWEVFFRGYDDDPREIPDIPEVVNWVEQSVEEGIPWFYFMKSPRESYGLLTFMCCYGTRNPKCPERYIFEKDRILPFIKKNLDNLAEFAEKYNIPDEVGCAATNEMMEFITEVIKETMDQEDPYEGIDRGKQIQEALERLSLLEKLFELNPKVKNYFKEGKLYYSYITGGGYIGSIDTINYDERYAAIVNAFEEQTSYLVYHVIEHGDTISLLYVSNDYNHWADERPTSSGVMAQVVSVDSYENESGYIKLDHFQGALRRSNNNVYPTRPENRDIHISDVDSEIVERLDILKNAGIITDFDITKIYLQEGELCCSLLYPVMGTPVGVIDRLSAKPSYEQLLVVISGQIPKLFYFVMESTSGKEIAFLYVSDEQERWEIEKLTLERGEADAVVVDIEEMTAGIRRIRYEIVNGGPLCICD